MYTEQNPHPDLEFIEKRPNETSAWYLCHKCGKYIHCLEHFGYQCPICQDENLYNKVK
jgi:rubrerythrin